MAGETFHLRLTVYGNRMRRRIHVETGVFVWRQGYDTKPKLD